MAAFFIAIAVTDADVSVYEGTTMFIVPAGTPGLKIIRNAGCGDEEAMHAYLDFDRVHIGAGAVLGGPASAPTTRNMPILSKE